MARTIKEKLEKILINIEFDVSDDDILEFLYDKRHLTSYRNIIKYNKPQKLSTLYKMVKFCVDCKTTLEKHIIMYGEEEGTRRFNSYREKQAYTNTFEYKNINFGLTRLEFDEYNKSRATTLTNMIKKYGEEEGTRRFNSYREKQAYTNTKEHLGDRYESINKQKGLTLINFQRKYGDDLGYQKFEEYITRSVSGYSKISQELFTSLLQFDIFKNKKNYFATLNGEYGVIDNLSKGYFKYDFVSLELLLCVEFHGDHYHGNPIFYKPDDFLIARGCGNIKAKDIWKKDAYKKELIKSTRNIDLIEVWETDYLTDKNNTIKRIVDYAENRI